MNQTTPGYKHLSLESREKNTTEIEGKATEEHCRNDCLRLPKMAECDVYIVTGSVARSTGAPYSKLQRCYHALIAIQ